MTAARVPSFSIPDGPSMNFDGFSPEMLKFLRGLKKHNNKAWFEAHRDEYDEVLRNPSRAFVETLQLLIRAEGLPIVASVKSSIFRIYRDIRFSKDKSPYKTHIGFSFPMEGFSKLESGGFYFGFEPAGATDAKVFVGGGVYMPSPDQLRALRKKIASRHAELSKLLRDAKFRKEFPEGITGEALKRMPVGYPEDHPAAELLKKKQFLFGSELKGSDLMNGKLPKLVLRKFSAGLDVASFLSK